MHILAKGLMLHNKMVNKLVSLKIRAARIVKSINQKKLAEWSSNPYATHLPVLIGLSRLFEISRVLELGCGQYSSLMFLNRSIFPSIKSVHSYETDSDWLDIVSSKINHDSRIKINLVEKEMKAVIKDLDMTEYDLVFVDDSTNAQARSLTIQEVCKRCVGSNLIVIHDYEVPEYQEASKSIPNRFTFTAFNPNTGILWKNRKVNKKLLKRLNHSLTDRSLQLAPDDIEGWNQYLIEEKNFSL